MKIKTRMSKKYMAQNNKKTLLRTKIADKKPFAGKEDSAQARFALMSATQAVKRYRETLNWLGGGD